MSVQKYWVVIQLETWPNTVILPSGRRVTNPQLKNISGLEQVKSWLQIDFCRIRRFRCTVCGVTCGFLHLCSTPTAPLPPKQLVGASGVPLHARLKRGGLDLESHWCRLGPRDPGWATGSPWLPFCFLCAAKELCGGVRGTASK